MLELLFYFIFFFFCKMSRRWRHGDGKSTGDVGREEETRRLRMREMSTKERRRRKKRTDSLSLSLSSHSRNSKCIVIRLIRRCITKWGIVSFLFVHTTTMTTPHENDDGICRIRWKQQGI